MANRLQLRRDTSTRWTSVNPILMSGEIGLETDTNKIKIGNGVKNWSQLDYFAAGGGGSSEPEIFWAVYGTTTATEIQTALDAGKVVMCKRDTFIYTLTDNNASSFRFFSFYNICTFKSFSVMKSNSSWSGIYTFSSLLTSDKISSTASTHPDDDKVYTALATKNLVDDKIGSAVSLTFTYDDDTTATYNLLTSNS